MSTKNADASVILPLLRSIVELWPKTGTENLEAVQISLRDRLAGTFDTVDLLNHVGSMATIKEFHGGVGSVSVDFSDEDGSLQRAIFELSDTDEWKLRSLKFQCPVCFGTGTNQGRTCTICNGKGWGAS